MIKQSRRLKSWEKITKKSFWSIFNLKICLILLMEGLASVREEIASLSTLGLGIPKEDNFSHIVCSWLKSLLNQIDPNYKPKK